MAHVGLLPRSFYARDALAVARELIGKQICRSPVVLKITEVEAYRYPRDTANHCRAGRTRRNATMWGPPGHAYVYLCYGIHRMLNLVTNEEGEGAAVLIRSCEPVQGLDEITRRRKGARGPSLLTGPGRVGEALGLSLADDGTCVCESGDLEVRDGQTPRKLLVGPRIGIGFADERDVQAPWRIADALSEWVSHRSKLRPR